jgi:HPt (histidine-containing phosphotransfer) domain-containing protein
MDTQMAIAPETFDMLKENFGEILPELISAFLEDGFILLDNIKTGIQENNKATIDTAAHTLKSSAKNMGADTLATICSELEKTDDLETAQHLYQQAVSEMQQAETELQNAL